MATGTERNTSLVVDHDTLWRRVLVGIDRSAESLEAARQAAILKEPGGSLTLLCAWTLPPPVIGVVSPNFVHPADERVEIEAATSAIDAVKACIDPEARATAKVARGFAWDELVKEITHGNATVVVVGSHGTGRMRGILLGSTATAVMRKAPCSVLVARTAAVEFPKTIVVGVDGSRESAVAYAAAAHLARRFGAELRPVVAHGGKGVDDEAVARIVDSNRQDLPGEPLAALLSSSVEADLVVVGSRGLHGPKAFRSVSERLAHQAQCSTLIVRELSNQNSVLKKEVGHDRHDTH